MTVFCAPFSVDLILTISGLKSCRGVLDLRNAKLKVRTKLGLNSYQNRYLGSQLGFVRAVNLKYISVGRLDDDMIVPPSDGPMFILINWE